MRPRSGEGPDPGGGRHLTEQQVPDLRTSTARLARKCQFAGILCGLETVTGSEQGGIGASHPCRVRAAKPGMDYITRLKAL
jgi:hypothetical protein